jgi:PKD repeat protein
MVSPNGVQVQYVRAWLPENETATRKNGEIDDSWTVGPPTATPVAAFYSNPAAPLEGQKIQFTDSGSGNPVSWTWNFGDGTSSPDQNPTHR